MGNCIDDISRIRKMCYYIGDISRIERSDTMEREIINLQTKRVEAEIHVLSAKVADAIEKLIEVQVALEELYLAIGDPEERG